MGKIKFTKGELKRQRDALKQYERYLPTLQLKKQQLQMEILHQAGILREKRNNELKKLKDAEVWAGLLVNLETDINDLIKFTNPSVERKNVAGVDIPVFKQLEFRLLEYDLFTVPLWVDAAIEYFKTILSLRAEISIVEKGINILKEELQITTQRVNLFEKVKIPQAQEAIRLIKIYIGDQMTNAVGRSKIAKKKIEEMEYEEVLV
ncbi:MAG: V-type ATP synthase subunit D [Candidatus Omnitrophota bacterium]